MKQHVKTTFVIVGAISLAWVGGGFAAAAGWVTGSPESTVTAATAAMPSFDSGPTFEETKRKVTLRWTRQRIAKGVLVQGYVVTRHGVNGHHTTVCGDVVTTAGCADTNVPAGTWTYTVRTVQGLWRGKDSPPSDPVTIKAPAPKKSAADTTTQPDEPLTSRQVSEAPPTLDPEPTATAAPVAPEPTDPAELPTPTDQAPTPTPTAEPAATEDAAIPQALLSADPVTGPRCAARTPSTCL